MKRHDIIPYARGDKPVDLLLTHAKIINVFSGEIVEGSIAIAGGRIVGIGDYQAEQIRDLSGRFVAPGFIDPHVHIESSMACVSQFARAVVPHGTTTVVADPHEIANVFGILGIEYMLKSAENQPMNVYFTLSSCVPATRMETSGARLDAVDLIPLMSHDRIVALAEMMNYPGVIHGDPDVLSKIKLARQYRKPVDGHSPGLSGKELNAYIASGISSDHECTTADEAREKLMAGMHIFIRQGTGARNLQDLLPIVTPRTFHRMMWCTDDRDPHDLLSEGHIDSMVREAIASGVDPIRAIQMATLNPAEYFGLYHLGAIAPGRQADLVVFSDLKRPGDRAGVLQRRKRCRKRRHVARHPCSGNAGTAAFRESHPQNARFFDSPGRRPHSGDRNRSESDHHGIGDRGANRFPGCRDLRPRPGSSEDRRRGAA